MARVTGLEPATSGVTGRRSNQLSYTRVNGGSGGIGTAPLAVKRPAIARTKRMTGPPRPARHGGDEPDCPPPRQPP